MAAEAAAAAAHSRNDQDASSSGCGCCFCRHGLNLGLHSALLLSSSDHKRAVESYASMVLFAASVAVIFARAGISTGRHQASRGQMHSFHDRRRGFLRCQVGGQDRKERYFVKKARKSRWEWRPVNRRSTACQTSSSSTDPFPVLKNPSAELATPSTKPEKEEVTSTPQEEVASGFTSFFAADVPSLEDFPVLSRDLDGKPRSGEEFEAQVVPTDATEIPSTSKCRSSHSSSESDSSSHQTTTTKQHQDQPPLNRKQRKHLKKKQKKLVAASHTLQLSSLPILKSWKSSSTSSSSFKINSNLDMTTFSPTSCKIYDCSKSFGPLGSPSGKSITWSFSSKPHDCLASIAFGRSKAAENASSSGSSLNTAEDKGSKAAVCEISEISESPKSYLGDWTDGESFRRSISDPEEVEMDVPFLDSEFEADSEDYSFPAV